jgi:hypothetical protein
MSKIESVTKCRICEAQIITRQGKRPYCDTHKDYRKWKYGPSDPNRPNAEAVALGSLQRRLTYWATCAKARLGSLPMGAGPCHVFNTPAGPILISFPDEYQRRADA